MSSLQAVEQELTAIKFILSSYLNHLSDENGRIGRIDSVKSDAKKNPAISINWEYQTRRGGRRNYDIQDFARTATATALSPMTRPQSAPSEDAARKFRTTI